MNVLSTISYRHCMVFSLSQYSQNTFRFMGLQSQVHGVMANLCSVISIHKHTL